MTRVYRPLCVAVTIWLQVCIQIMFRDYSQVLGYHRTCRNAKPRRYASIVTRNPVVSYAGVETGDNLIVRFCRCAAPRKESRQMSS
ncbi:hypothetical protein CMEL01_07023 [Colletotrichum melonis]|uniref:Uncharacterized protein n=1 Tax=Colletotrichum melonis TaxID=1209925 RepID=A0AAI9XIS9_9PEZI|nr:hypothetical protein CMEL01_07023 [Colletotrichum melonis]